MFREAEKRLQFNVNSKLKLRREVDLTHQVQDRKGGRGILVKKEDKKINNSLV